MRRYSKDRRIRGGKLETAKTVTALRRAKEFGLIPLREVILTEDQRLDHVAHQYLGNAQLWWVLAAFSDIGWGLQLPAGTIIQVPTDMSSVMAIIG